MHWMEAHTEGIGFWAAALTTVSFVPQVLRSWRSGGQGLSWAMLALFATGVGLWLLYGILRASAPLILANGLTEIQVLFLIALKVRQALRLTETTSSENPQT